MNAEIFINENMAKNVFIKRLKGIIMNRKKSWHGIGLHQYHYLLPRWWKFRDQIEEYYTMIKKKIINPSHVRWLLSFMTYLVTELTHVINNRRLW